MLNTGSSPHTRDKLESLVSAVDETGIIPAYAGQICNLYISVTIERDHPRIRGTNPSFIIWTHLQTGSSPHTRDKLLLVL